MPVVLSQHPYNERYRDVEGVIYNFPRQYFKEIKPFEPFLYYRPSKGALRNEASCYFGYGQLGPIYDTYDAEGKLRTVEIMSVDYFQVPVPFRDPFGNLFESDFSSPSAFQGRAVRRIGDNDFHRILAAANVSSVTYSSIKSSEVLALQGLTRRKISPLRSIVQVPPGTGYLPSGEARPDPAEIAALQERARADHQRAIQVLVERTISSGGECFMNNNIDLLTRSAAGSILFEAKSLLDPRMAVDRMRYAIGQLADYENRYSTLISGSRSAIAFASSLGSDTSFVGDVLDSKGIGLIIVEKNSVSAQNEAAKKLALFV